MKIYITGGLGFIGIALSKRLVAEGHEVTVVNRSVSRAAALPKGVSIIKGDTTVPGEWQKEIAGHDVIINLAGASIFSRWNKKKKEEIYNSRVLTTKNIVDALYSLDMKKAWLFSASAVGYYGNQDGGPADESFKCGDDFLAGVCRAWEEAALKAEKIGTRVVLCRFATVLGHEGALKQLVPLFKKYIGAVLGSGKQWFPWIHYEDIIEIFLFLMKNINISGPVNFVSPGIVNNRVFTKALSAAAGKPVYLPAVPGFVLKIILGGFAENLLNGRIVEPKVLLRSGYSFRFGDIDSALGNIMRKD
jgi:uncharacterized protein